MNEVIRVMMADDHHVVRQGLVALLKTVPDFQVVTEATDGQETSERYDQSRPDVALMDLRMPRLGGVEAIAQIRQKQPGARIIVLTTFNGDEDIYRAIQAGCKRLLAKGNVGGRIDRCNSSRTPGKSRIPSIVAKKLADRMSGPGLTSRELEVLKGIVAGRSNKEIGTDLSISEATVKTHINNLLGKLGVGDRMRAARVALQRGIVHLP